MFADVAVPLPIYKTFVYQLPNGINGQLGPGCRVLVPFGNRRIVGVVVRVHSEIVKGNIKMIEGVLDKTPLFSSKMVDLAQWIASYYLAPLGKVFSVMLPPGLLGNKAWKSKKFVEDFWPTKQQKAVVEINPSPEELTEKQKQVLQKLNDLEVPIFIQPFMRDVGCSYSVLNSLVLKGVIQIRLVEMERSPWPKN